MQSSDFLNDISISAYVKAFSGTSWAPEKRAESYRNDYAASLASDYAKLEQHAEQGGTADLLAAEFSRYHAGYMQRMRAWLSSRSRCLSMMIAGPSNFPVRRANKRNDIEHRRLSELIDYRSRAMSAAIRNLRPDLRPIMAGDDNAIERLEAKLRGLEWDQDRMKRVNAAHKAFLKNPDSLLDADINEQEKALVRRYQPEYSWEPHPYAPYQLSNNNATIRNTKQRIELLTAVKAQPERSEESTNGIRLEDSPADNRIRLFFPGKPDADIRAKLKAHGFRWAPTIGAWQAYRNYRSIPLAQSFVTAPGA